MIHHPHKRCVNHSQQWLTNETAMNSYEPSESLLSYFNQYSTQLSQSVFHPDQPWPFLQRLTKPLIRWIDEVKWSLPGDLIVVWHHVMAICCQPSWDSIAVSKWWSFLNSGKHYQPLWAIITHDSRILTILDRSQPLYPPPSAPSPHPLLINIDPYSYVTKLVGNGHWWLTMVNAKHPDASFAPAHLVHKIQDLNQRRFHDHSHCIAGSCSGPIGQ